MITYPLHSRFILIASAISLLLLCVVSPSGFSQLSTIVMQDDFHYKTDNIDGHSPTKGSESWRKWYAGVVSADGNMAAIVTEAGKAEAEEGHAKASYPFDLTENTLYTLKVTFKFKPVKPGEGGWVGFGFGTDQSGGANNEGGDTKNTCWMMLSPMVEASEGAISHGYVEAEEVGNTVIPADDYNFPITAKVTWNTRTGEVKYYINNQVQLDWTPKKLTASESGNRIFLEGLNTCNSTKVTNVTLSAEPAKK